MAIPTITTPTPEKSNLEKVLVNVSKDFAAIKKSFARLNLGKKQETAIRSSQQSDVRRTAYKEKFSKVVKTENIDDGKRNLKDTTKSFFDSLSSIGGVLGTAFAYLGVAGIIKMLLSATGTGKYVSGFVTNIFTSITDLIKKTANFLLSIFQDSQVRAAFVKAFSSLFSFLGSLLYASFSLIKTLLTDNEVIQTLGRIVKSIFTVIFDGIIILTEIIKDLFNQNGAAIKDGVVQFLTEILRTLTVAFEVAKDVFTTAVNNPEFIDSMKNVFKNFWYLIVEAFKQDYKTASGETTNIWFEIGEIIGKMALFYGALLSAKVLLMKAVRDLSMAKFDFSKECDCGMVGPDDLDRDKKKPTGKGRKPSTKKGSVGDRLGKFGSDVAEGAKNLWGKVSSFGENIYNKAKGLGKAIYGYLENRIKSSARYFRAIFGNPSLRKKVNGIILQKLGQKVAEYFGKLATKATVAAAGITTGGVITVLMTALAVADTALLLYAIYELLFVTTDGEKEDGGYFPQMAAEIEKWLKENPETTPLPAPEEAPAATPNLAQLNKEGSRIGAGYAEAAAPSVAPMPIQMAPAPRSTTTPSQSAVASAESDVSKAQVIGAGSAAATAALQEKMKKGDVSAEPHEAGTDVLAQNLMGFVPGFKQFTAFDDAFHGKVSPGSKHNSGLAIDFTVNGGSKEYAAATAAVRKHLSDLGLGPGDVRVIDELNNPSSKATGPHIHVQFQSKEAADRYRSLFPNVQLTALAKESNDIGPVEGTPFTMAKNAMQEIPEQKQKSFASKMIEDMMGGMTALDEMSGGKLGLASSDMKSLMRGLEDELNKGTTFIDNSVKIASQKVEERIGSPRSVAQTNENVLSAILNRQTT